MLRADFLTNVGILALSSSNPIKVEKLVLRSETLAKKENTLLRTEFLTK